ncbi:MAG: UDP-N-acetylglucosamine 1-carboxyvinyltransferase [candidate division WOR-3 bacterium]
MDKFLIKGGKRLKGEVVVASAKNAVLPLMAASILAEGEVRLKNVPDLMDVRTMSTLLSSFGCLVKREGKDLIIDPKGINNLIADYEIVRKMRASFFVLGPLLVKYKRAKVSLPGGCAIGPRPVDLHLKGLSALGANLKVEEGYVVGETKGLKGEEILLMGNRGPSVGATANVLMAAVLAEGKTVIEGAACEPEIVDLANFLSKMGAKIKGAGTPRIEVEGVKGLSGVEYQPIPDRIEAGTLACACAITGGEVRIKNCLPEHLTAVLEKLRECGVEVEEGKGEIRIKREKDLLGVNITTAPYPGFPTDMQAQFMALLTIANGKSVITETIFEDRLTHAVELQRFGAKITVNDNIAIVEGIKELSGAPVMASDLRASASLVLAGLVAKGETIVSRIYHLDRGYERLEEKLNSLGAEIRRVSD